LIGTSSTDPDQAGEGVEISNGGELSYIAFDRGDCPVPKDAGRRPTRPIFVLGRDFVVFASASDLPCDAKEDQEPPFQFQH